MKFERVPHENLSLGFANKVILPAFFFFFVVFMVPYSHPVYVNGFA